MEFADGTKKEFTFYTNQELLNEMEEWNRNFWKQALWGGAVVAREAHNPKVGGSIPPPATDERHE